MSYKVSLIAVRTEDSELEASTMLQVLSEGRLLRIADCRGWRT